MPLETGILTTKLYRPRISGELVPRPRLVERLEARRDRPLTLVSAPAGYGKTTLISNWLEACDCPTAWLSLDEDDNDLVRFLTYLLAAVETMFPNAVAETRSLLSAAGPPPLPVVTRSLINELDQVECPFILVLDDYHHIDDLTVHELLNELLTYPPRPMHLVLISRTDPPLSLPTLRARRQVTEVRTDQLRFTREETASFVQQEMGMSVDDRAVTALLQRMEGWVTGLRLLTLSLRHRGSVDISPARLSGNVSYVMDYLVTEVLDDQPPAIYDCLLRTAILDRISAPLCEAVCRGSAPADDDAGDVELSGQAFVAWLLENNPFLVRLDDSGEWYRYHHLLRELLQSRLEQRLGVAGIAALHRRASAWFARNQLINEALHHALAAGEPETAANMVAQHRHTLIDGEQWQRLERWLRMFDQATIEAQAELSIIEAWVHNVHGRWQEELAALTRVEMLLAGTEIAPEVADPIRGEIYVLRANLLGWTYDGQAVLHHAERALELLPHEWRYAYTSAYMIAGFGDLLSGGIDRAVARIRRGLADSQTASKPQHRSMLLFGLTGAYWVDLNFVDMRQVAQQYLAVSREYHLPEATAVSQYYLGCIHYLQNDLLAAETHFSAVANTPYTVSLNWHTQGVCGLALTYRALGQSEQASELLTEFQNRLIERNNFALLEVVKGSKAELALSQGDIAQAVHWAESYDPQPFVGLQMLYIPQLTQVKAWLAQDTAASRELAGNQLAQLAEIVHGAHLKSALLPVLALQALLDDAQGQESAALANLREAIALAETSSVLRVFVDLGPRMADLLVRLRQRGVAPEYVARILAAFPESTTDHGRQVRIEPMPLADRPSSPLVEPLTDREMDVLALLAQRLTNKEIAAQLFISPGTVRQHTYQIYQKLDVHNRREAVAKAQTVNILPPT
ncbi:MAG: LuxR C-terminal-related transcriptional regulator [Anaerolineae bacterium]